ncbi:MAG: hypothetical protein KGR18_10460 [Acidobacteria bacterium]|nr:hypothetical protein [Acidobacteriota bacterium]MBU6330358.1 hypothetical protein [Acidobacteriota bacterium]
MSGNWGYVAAAWVIVFGSLAGYAARTIRRGRSISTQVPPERRRWS